MSLVTLDKLSSVIPHLASKFSRFDQQLYDEIDEQEEDINALEMIKEEDVQLVCYQWFKPLI